MAVALERLAEVSAEEHVRLLLVIHQIVLLVNPPLAPQVEVLLGLEPATGAELEPPQAHEPPLALELEHPPSVETSVETPPAPGQALEGHCHCQLHDFPEGRPPAP